MIKKNINKTYNENYYLFHGKRFEDYSIFNIYYKKYKFHNKILDFGCGVGLFLDCANKNYNYKKRNLYGYDINEYAINKLKEKGYNYFDINNKENNFFGTIFCYQVLEHIKRAEVIKVLSRFYDLLEKDGKLYIYCPIDYAREIDNDPTHINFMNYYWLINYSKSLGFKIIKNNGNSLLFHKYTMSNLFVYILSNLMYRLFKYKPSSIELILQK